MLKCLVSTCDMYHYISIGHHFHQLPSPHSSKYRTIYSKGMKEYRVVVLGSGGVGKTTLTVKFVYNYFVKEDYDPGIEDSYRKEIDVDGSPAIVDILDTDWSEPYACMRDPYIRNGQGFLLIYSIINAESFIDVQSLRDQITRVKGGLDSPIILVGNKYDLAAERSVTMHEGESLAHEWGIQFFETSAKTGHNVQEMFLEIVQQIHQKMPSDKSHHCCIVL